MAEADSSSVEPQARHVVYCGVLLDTVCTLPPEVRDLPPALTRMEVKAGSWWLNASDENSEYCEFGGTAKKCEDWLKDEHEDLWTRLYSDDALNANLSSLSVSAQERAAKDAAKKEAKAAQVEARDAERKAASKVQIKRVERNKRKHVTVIIGLEVFGLENKKLAKELGKKFATGSSVTRSPAGAEEITVQGDVSDDVRDWLLEVYGSKVPEANIEMIEDKKKKSTTT
ncbi:Translation machinery-associated protein 22 [Penicillium macrosclerotiorum]|uniref:Translation machinery-associated protein 22 n=1 Tax=Penicillium macrosclerotiorum TaxID=303699 RepID=UPI002546BD7D|nr:Translation machinery-associated protein 22 [Penicillium macrosclerotiorum]KAJ5689790.1 Translation machinery-associated protein 22 [Penicillium macrosclerotiorum]